MTRTLERYSQIDAVTRYLTVVRMQVEPSQMLIVLSDEARELRAAEPSACAIWVAHH